MFFLHIPKTAGTSVAQILESNFSEHDAAVNLKESVLARLLAPTAVSDVYVTGRLLVGHLPLKVCKNFVRPVHVLTFLRNPVELAISFYRHHRRHNRLPQFPTIEAFLMAPEGVSVMNMQCRWLAGICEPTIDVVYGAGSPTMYANPIEDVRRQVSEPALLDAALANLRKLSFIGFVEEFETSVEHMVARFGWRKPQQVPSLNVDVSKMPPIGREVLDELKRINHLDMLLYAEAKATCGQRALQKPISRGYRTLESEYCFLNLSDPFIGDGWYFREIWPIWGGACWSGPSRHSSIELPFKLTKPMFLEFTVISAISDACVYGLRVRVNGIEIDYSVRQDDTIFYISGGVPESAILDVGYTTLELDVPMTVSPFVIDPGNEDRRQLGIALKFVCIYPLYE